MTTQLQVRLGFSDTLGKSDLGPSQIYVYIFSILNLLFYILLQGFFLQPISFSASVFFSDLLSILNCGSIVLRFSAHSSIVEGKHTNVFNLCGLSCKGAASMVVQLCLVIVIKKQIVQRPTEKGLSSTFYIFEFCPELLMFLISPFLFGVFSIRVLKFRLSNVNLHSSCTGRKNLHYQGRWRSKT